MGINQKSLAHIFSQYFISEIEADFQCEMLVKLRLTTGG